MADNEQEERLPKRRPFTFDIDSRMIDVLKAYEAKEEEIILYKKLTSKKRRFIK